MKLGHKIAAIALAAIIGTATSAILVQRHIIHAQGIELLHQGMRDAITEAETVRESISRLGRNGAFDHDKLLAI